MGHSNGVISAPVSLHADVYTVLGLAKTGDFYDTVYACANTHGKINMWSRYKPVRWNNKPGITSQNAQWWKGEDGRCGIKLPIGITTYKNIPSNMTADKKNGWQYLPPTAGVHFCAIDFFENYKHNATCFIHNFTVDKVVSKDEYLTATCVLGISEAPDPDGNKSGPGSIALEDLRGETLSGEDALTLGDYYLGIVVLDSNGNVKGRVVGGQGANHLATKYKAAGLALGQTYKAYPFLAKYEMGQDEADRTNSYFTIPNTTFAEFKVGSQEEADGLHITLTARYVYLNGTTKVSINYSLVITTDAETRNLRNNYIQMRFSTNSPDAAMQGGEASTRLDEPITVTYGQPYRKNGSFSIDPAYASRSYYVYLTLDTAKYTKRMEPLAESVQG